MNTTMENILLGAVGSVVGTFLFLIINSYWKSCILPWLEDRVYQGIRVEGKWAFERRYNDKEKQTYILEITQKADKLKGTCTLVSDISEGSGTTTNSFVGYISDGYMIGTARPISRDSLYHTTLHFKIMEDLDAVKMVGVYVSMSLEKNELMPWIMTFKKIN